MSELIKLETGHSSAVASAEEMGNHHESVETKMCALLDNVAQIDGKITEQNGITRRLLNHTRFTRDYSQALRAAKLDDGEVDMTNADLQKIRSQADVIEEKSQELFLEAAGILHNAKLASLTGEELKAAQAEASEFKQQAEELRSIAKALKAYSDKDKLSREEAQNLFDILDDQIKGFNQLADHHMMITKELTSDRTNIWKILLGLQKKLNSVKSLIASKIGR